jgi:hypothetical protein
MKEYYIIPVSEYRTLVNQAGSKNTDFGIQSDADNSHNNVKNNIAQQELFERADMRPELKLKMVNHFNQFYKKNLIEKQTHEQDSQSRQVDIKFNTEFIYNDFKPVMKDRARRLLSFILENNILSLDTSGFLHKKDSNVILKAKDFLHGILSSNLNITDTFKHFFRNVFNEIPKEFIVNKKLSQSYSGGGIESTDTCKKRSIKRTLFQRKNKYIRADKNITRISDSSKLYKRHRGWQKF